MLTGTSNVHSFFLKTQHSILNTEFIVPFTFALVLRVLVWEWQRLYPLGGDEREYLAQALTLLRERRYEELPLMRPPLYTTFLAGSIYLFESLVQRLRLIQALLSALTVIPITAITLRLFGDRRVALVAGLLAALSYTLATAATELLSETLFLCGLACFLWLLLRAGGARGRSALMWTACAGLTLGALALVRSVALPLLPLSALWLLVNARRHALKANGQRPPLLPALILTAAFCAMVLPWTARNYLSYGAVILIDTTGAENLWLDNNPAGAAPGDPLGREAAKRELYALGDDRAARQRLATERGTAAILGNPAWFAGKAWGEAQTFFALQFFDDMRDRRAIWVPPHEVWLRLILGDGLWLATLFAGVVGMSVLRVQPLRVERSATIHPANPQTPNALTLSASTPSAQGATKASLNAQHNNAQRATLSPDPRWIFIPWVLYVFATAMLFHVELRYRLPLYPVLIPFAAWTLARGLPQQLISRTPHRTRIVQHTSTNTAIPTPNVQHSTPNAQRATRNVQPPHTQSPTRNPQRATPNAQRAALAALPCLAILGLMLLHRPYPAEILMLAQKHTALWHAERALNVEDIAGAQGAARQALAHDEASALARIALARAAIFAGNLPAARSALDDALDALPDHPQSHMLRGAVLRAGSNEDAARSDLAYETATLQNAQAWAWEAFAPLGPAPTILDLGDGLDLGFVRGFHAAEPDGFRWTREMAALRLSVPVDATTLELRVGSGRPQAFLPFNVTVLVGDREIGRFTAEPNWHTVRLPLPDETLSRTGEIVVTLQSETFRPRDFDRASPDDRMLGVMLDTARVVRP
jgi:4-amino-4-deoxy-L-arabinose transferase-like glycosyltransferase